MSWLPSRRSAVYATHGCIATSQPAASEIGLRILRAGGNAADACVAAAAALNVAEPTMTGIGGDVFCLFWDAKTRRVHGLNGSGRSPLGLDAARARATGGPAGRPAATAGLDPSSVHCVTVPGAAAAWADTVAQFGTLPLSEVLAPAIDLAEAGVPVHEIAAHCWAEQEHQLTRWGERTPGAAALLVDGRAPKAGEVMVMRELASTFRALGREGKAGFYRGRVAQAIVDVVRRCGGALSLADLEAHATEVRQMPVAHEAASIA